jgi:hypothetical protein
MASSIKYFASDHEACSTARTVRVAEEVSSDPQSTLQFERVDGEVSSPQPDFVWLNTPTKAGAALVDGATVYNHLSGCSVFEDKAKMALLQERMSVPTLKSRVFKSAAAFAVWCRRSAPAWTHLWVAKNPMTNSGVGVWVLGPQNWESVVAEVTAAACGPSAKASSIAVVVQRYVDRPLLWRGRKLQLRLYVIVTGDLSVWVYRHGLIQVCNKPFPVGEETAAGGANVAASTAEKSAELSAASFDSEVHITNVCRNKDNATLFEAERPTDVAVRYPVVFAHAKRVLADMVRAARPYVARQRSAHHFEYMGVGACLVYCVVVVRIDRRRIFLSSLTHALFRSHTLVARALAYADFIADADTGYAWLIECNLPPNNVGSTMAAGSAIEGFHQTIWSDIIHAFVVPPIAHGRRCCAAAEVGLWERAAAPLADEPFVAAGGAGPGGVPGGAKAALAGNQLAWLLFQKKMLARQRADMAASGAAAPVATISSSGGGGGGSSAASDATTVIDFGRSVLHFFCLLSILLFAHLFFCFYLDDFGSGSPSPSLLACDIIQRASLLLFDAERRRVQLPGDAARGALAVTYPRHALQYGSPGGDPHEWLPALSRFLTAQSGRAVAAAALVTTAGCSHALDLLCSAFASAGDVALVEDPTCVRSSSFVCALPSVS